MDSALTEIGLPIALAIIMFGLGLDLTLADFRRVAKHPKAVIVALACQLVLLPAICFGLVVLFDLPPLLGIGMLLLAASPGGTTANLFSHLFRGDVALNVSLTAVNSVVALVTLPLITNFAIDHYDLGDEVSLPFAKVVEVFAIVLVPVVIGMLVRANARSWALRMDKPVRIAFYSCQNWEAGFFNAQRAIASEPDLDLVICLGDYMYEYSDMDPNKPRQDRTGTNKDGDVQTAVRAAPFPAGSSGVQEIAVNVV